MYSMEYHLKTNAPVLISSGSDDLNMTGTLDYIPGKTLLGALTAQYIKRKKLENAHEDKEFARWFLYGKLIFSNAYPRWEGEQYFPAPISLHVGKETGKIYNLFEDILEETPKGINGFIYINGDELKKKTPEKSFSFHSARKDRIKGKSTDGTIFNYESLQAGQDFCGFIRGEKKDLMAVKKMFGDRLELQIGRSRSVQYGAVSLEFKEIIPYSQLNKSIGKRITVTLLSPAILWNEYGYPEVSEEILKQYLEDALETKDFKISSFYARSDETESYVGVWKLKSPSAKALAAGTSFMMEFPELKNKTKEKLHELAFEGIGERTWEGFGRVEFNILPDEQIRLEEPGNRKVHKQKRPMGTMPVELNQCFSQVVEAVLERQVNDQGLRDAADCSDNTAGKSLNSSMVGKLELMLKNADSPEEFREMIKNIKKIGKDKLKACRNKKKRITLLDALESGGMPFRLSIEGDLGKLTKELSFRPENPDLQKRLYRVYWLSFFNTMRKLNKRRESK
ncbi:RAMP superfamily CRISPR-associated protein [Dehalobacterium formicoaceticum]|uniref:CRISPR type III-associated protein domain-containing protein n=1 Tax=Dehalobacterium formicoaceticum TaxID=51515 RepID=A0ABT1Y8J6_9FIRM|nr:RAMP superfamily CRISPR-associated protein [Dehalobacterium formicoaceticum]MCR6546878.1 hypothetical protein [Dehalobacterium formicoaceticum]